MVGRDLKLMVNDNDAMMVYANVNIISIELT
jgi:hypothetical protein